MVHCFRVANKINFGRNSFVVINYAMCCFESHQFFFFSLFYHPFTCNTAWRYINTTNSNHDYPLWLFLHNNHSLEFHLQLDHILHLNKIAPWSGNFHPISGCGLCMLAMSHCSLPAEEQTLWCFFGYWPPMNPRSWLQIWLECHSTSFHLWPAGMKSKYSVKRPLTIQKHGALDSFIVHLTFGSHWTKILALFYYPGPVCLKHN